MRKICVAALFMLVCYCCSQSVKAPARAPFEFKDLLSDYQFFEGSLKQLHPRNGVTGYQLATPLFTDYSVKDRFIVLPKDSFLTYTSGGLPIFPDSTFIVKNFAYNNVNHEKIMIETRVLFKDPYDHGWKVMNYLWNEAQTDASRWIAGKRIPITFLDDQGQQHTTLYQMPNTNDCKRCHINNSVLTPIGPKIRNLNWTPPGTEENQLQRWAAAGILHQLPDLAQVNKLPVWTDSIHFTVSDRARAYLDVNCAHCHIKGGDAYNTGLFLDFESTASAPGVYKSPVSAGGGAGGLDYDIVPGDAGSSILAYRMNSVEPGVAMPELARTVIHKEGVALITKWINEMPKAKKDK